MDYELTLPDGFDKFHTQLLPLYNILISFPGLILIFIVISHYLPQRGGFVATCYLAISTMDAVMVIGSLVSYLMFYLWYSGSVEVLSWEPMVMCMIVTGIALRISVFENVVLAVSRTIKIVRPFTVLKKGYAVGASVVYAASWVGIGSYDAYCYAFHIHPFNEFTAQNMRVGEQLSFLLAYSNLTAFCQEGDEECADITFHTLLFSFSLVPFFLPSLTVLACMVVQLMWLNKPSPQNTTNQHHVTSNQRHVTANQHHVTTTILLLTVVFFLGNTITAVWHFIQWTLPSVSNVETLEELSFSTKVIITMISDTTLPLLNAALSPLILICRSDNFFLPRRVISRFTTRSSNRAPATTQVTDNSGIRPATTEV